MPSFDIVSKVNSMEVENAVSQAQKELATRFKFPVVVSIEDARPFTAAEDYHQDYYANNSRQPYCRIVIEPKIAKLREHYREKLKQ